MQRVGDEQAARPPVDVTELLTRQRNHRCVDHGSHFFNVVEEKPVEEDFVGILQSAQIDVSLQVVVFSLVGLIRTHHLLIKALDMWRQKSVQSKLAPFVLRERCAFVEPLAVQEIHAMRDIWGK